MTDLLWWAAIGVLLGISASQWLGFDGSKPVAVLQSLSLPALACALPLAVLAGLAGRWAVVALCLLPLATLAHLVLRVARVRAPAAAEPVVTLAFGNLLARNHHPAQAAQSMAATDADVLVMVEFTPDMHGALLAAVGCHYPHRIQDVRPDPAGIAVWSRLPMEGSVVHVVNRPSVDAMLHLGDCRVRLLAIHTTPPTMRARLWRDELRTIGTAAAGPAPTILVGDFNAARWHPSFRSLLARGWRSGHELLGKGWSVSWPMRGYPAPPFVRIDHALVDDVVVPTSVREVHVAGSDHRGFVMSFGLDGRAGQPPAQ